MDLLLNLTTLDTMPANTTSGNRILSVDILRGIVMVIMALDHTRDYFSNFFGNPTDLTVVSSGMFLTRWITHYCAPIFIFLSGTSAYLSLAKKGDKKAASVFLLKRGLWLILLEVTLVRLGWLFNFDYSLVVFQVIWAIGWSMLFLSLLIHLPYKLLLGFSLLMIAGHNLLDVYTTTPDTPWGIAWFILHQGGGVPWGEGNTIFVIYPLIPWIGVMAAGYCFGKLLQQPAQQRDKLLYIIGGGAVLLFIVLRAMNSYGNPNQWQVQDTWFRTVLSFLDCTKYPPSLLYLLMTIGPAILLMLLLERVKGSVGKFFTVYGRVPMFYYILHIYLIHLMAVITATIVGAPLEYFTSNALIFAPKEGWGYDLPGVYLAWVVAVLLLYFPSRWFMKVKQQHKKWWLSYI